MTNLRLAQDRIINISSIITLINVVLKNFLEYIEHFYAILLQEFPGYRRLYDKGTITSYNPVY